MQRAAAAPFKLLKYFSLASSIAIVAATITLALVYEHVSVRDLLEREEEHHVALTQVAANVLREEISSLLQGSGSAKLREAIVQDLAGTRVLKVKIFDLKGMTVFSTEARQIGEDKSGNGGFISARAGKPVSELTRRNQLSAFEGEVENVDVLSSYVPIFRPGSTEAVAVFEIYSDLSGLLGRIRDTRKTVLLAVSAVLLLLYGALFFIVRHADGVIKGQEDRLREARDEVDRSEQFHRALIEHSFEAVLILDPQLVVRHATPSVHRVTGSDDAGLVGRPFTDLLEPRERERAASWLNGVLAEPQSSRGIELAHGIRGGAAFLEAVATNELGHPVIHGVVLNMRDISVRKYAEMEIRRLALYDSLTGLANRELFMQLLTAEAARTVRRGDCAAVLFIDLDGFKEVNDSLGHPAGDELLKEVGARIRSAIRAGDVIGRDGHAAGAANIARLGGDEFTVVLPGLACADDAGVVSGRLLEQLAQAYEVAGNRVVVTASIGIALCPQDGSTVEELLRNADAAMYEAKKRGKNTFCFFSGTAESPPPPAA